MLQTAWPAKKAHLSSFDRCAEKTLMQQMNPIPKMCYWCVIEVRFHEITWKIKCSKRQCLCGFWHFVKPHETPLLKIRILSPRPLPCSQKSLFMRLLGVLLLFEKNVLLVCYAVTRSFFPSSLSANWKWRHSLALWILLFRAYRCQAWCWDWNVPQYRKPSQYRFSHAPDC